MKIKVLLGVLVSILSLGFTGCKNTEEDNTKEIKEDYENLLSSEKEYEYVKIIHKNGSSTERYRDISSNVERTDSYDENDKFESRIILDSNIKLLTSVGKDENGEWFGYKEVLSDPVMKENTKFLNTSIIDNICKEYIALMLDNNYISREKVNELIKYSDNNNNTIYVNPKTSMITKVEFEENDNIVGCEFEILDKLKEEDLNISAKNKENIDLSKTKIEDRGKQEGMDGPSLG